MSNKSAAMNTLRGILFDRYFTPAQVNRILPALDPKYLSDPHSLAKVLNCWNSVMSSASRVSLEDIEEHKLIPAMATPGKNSYAHRKGVTINSILADGEPKLLNIDPQKLIQRHEKIRSLGLFTDTNELWYFLHKAPAGLYLQDWSSLTKKIMYIDHKVLDILYDKKELKNMKMHPMVGEPRVIETDFDHIRTRYMFANKVGYGHLSQLYPIASAVTRPKLKDLLLSDLKLFLQKFAPHNTSQEYECFSQFVIGNHIESDEADLFEEMAELEKLQYEAWPRVLNRNKLEELRRSQND